MRIAAAVALALSLATSPALADLPAALSAPATATTRADADGVMFGFEVGVGQAGNRLRIAGPEAQLGWIFHRRAALFATASVGVLEASDANIYASIGAGGRAWRGRTFFDARIERMSLVTVECEETCSPSGATRYTAGIGVDAIRGPYGAMQVSLKAMRLVGVSAIAISIGGYLSLR